MHNLEAEWPTTAENPTGYHSSPLQIGKRVYNFQELTKNWMVEDWKNVLISVGDIQMVESEFGINIMRTWIHHTLLPLCRLVVVV